MALPLGDRLLANGASQTPPWKFDRCVRRARNVLLQQRFVVQLSFSRLLSLVNRWPRFRRLQVHRHQAPQDFPSKGVVEVNVAYLLLARFV